MKVEIGFSAPQPRVEVGSHHAFIKKLSISSDGQRILTASDDKTARIWDTFNGRLLSVLRVPIEPGHEGMLYAGTLSPDGRFAAVGGFTGLSGTSGAMVYLFSADTGILLGAIAGLPPLSVENLAFSPDGSILAICQADGGGVLLYDLQKRGVISRNSDPADKILGAAWSPRGDFTITTVDGWLWHFSAASGFETPRRLLLDGGRPMHVQFSPNGAHLAVGFDARPEIALVDVAAWRVERRLTLPASERQTGQHVVDWSADGRWLYSGGQPADPDNARIYRWSADGSSPPQRVLTASRRISDLRRLPSGGFAFSTGASEVGIVDGGHRLAWLTTSSTVDPGLRVEGFSVSRDGSRVSFTASPSGQAFTFDLNRPPDSALSMASDPSGAKRRPSAPGWTLASARDGAEFSVQSHPIDLDHAERVRTWTITPDDRQVVVGTAWSLRLLDRGGRLIWRADAPDDTRAVVVTEDNRFAVAAFADGTMRWYRMDDGSEIVALLAHRNGTDWVAWIPSGYYMSSVNGDNLIGWHLNNGVDQTPDFYRAIQFERVLYRPDVVREYFRAAGRTDVRSILADASAFRIDDLRRLAPPRLEVRNLTVQAGVPATAHFTLAGLSKSLPVQDYTVFVNDIPVTPWSDRILPSTDQLGFERNLAVPLTSRGNRIRIEAFNGQSMGVVETTVDSPTASTGAVRGDLYLVAIGTSDFADPDVRDLRFAARDADELASYFRAAEGRLFEKVHVVLASDNADAKPVRATIEALLPEIRKARSTDTVVVFLASHGLSDKSGNYYFVPADGRLTDVESLDSGAATADSLIPWQVFFEEMRRAAGRRLLIVDTCSAGDMKGTFDVHSLAKRSAASRFAIVAASRGDERSQEYAAGQHGIFTFGLLEGLRTGVDPDADGRTTLREVFEHAFQVVQERRTYKTLPQTPQLEATETLAGTVLSAAIDSDKAQAANASGVN